MYTWTEKWLDTWVDYMDERTIRTGDMGDMALSPFALEPCSCPQESGAILGDGLCQWDIDRAGDGEVLSAAEEV